MSQDFMDPEIFADFIVEAKEHLETIEPNLLELEKEPGNTALLNEIFRPMHSLKGASGFLGLNKINTLSHRAENVMDELRKGDMAVTADIMDIILSATDALRQMIDNLEAENTEGDVETEDIQNRLDAVLAGEVAPPAAEEAATEPETAVPAPEGDEVAASTEEVSATPTQSNEDEQDAPAQDPEAAATAPAGEDIMASADTLAEGDTYALTAFGEGHLKDFIEEAKEITENLNEGLLLLEKNPDEDHGELVNDLFRYFHNLKGNSGIIGYNELNSLTHEAETLLNNVRKDEMPITPELVDLLLYVVDIIETLVEHIDTATGQVTPVVIDESVVILQKAVNEGVVQAPVRGKSGAELAPVQGEKAATTDEASGGAAPEKRVRPEGIEGDFDEDDMTLFGTTIRQQKSSITLAIAELKKDSEQKDYVDALFRSLTTAQNSCSYMNFEEVKVHAERTAGLVDTARSSDMDFSLMIDILEQEVAILFEMLDVELRKLGEPTEPSNEPSGAPAGEAGAPPADTVDATDTPSSGSVDTDGADPAPAKETASKEAASSSPAAAPAEPKPAPEAAKPAAKQPEKKVEKAAPAPAAKAPAKPAPAKPASKPAGDGGGAAAAAPKAKTSSTIRVDHEKLDHLMNLIGELIINRNRYTMLARHLEDEQNVNLAEVAQSLSETTYAMARISDDLQDTIMKVRMVPVSSVFSRFPRLVRDLSRKSGKEVDLIMEGEETELDKSVVEVIGDPLVHLIRNSMDHGIESEEVRIAAGKPAKGSVWLRAYHKGNSVAIEIEDDGKGIDPDAMREVAIKKGVISPEEAKALDDREAMELIFAPGFSSAEKITDISGRGVGMDVVRNNIKNLKGSVSIHSEVGKGTRFTLSLPLTLAIIDALMVNVDGDLFAIPLDAVSETTKIEASRLTDVNNRKAVTLRGEVLGIVDLSELLEISSESEDSDVLSVVVIHDNDRRLGLVVDSLLERQEIVIKPLGAYLGDLKGISGATIMGDGSVILILDPHEIYMMATSKAI